MAKTTIVYNDTTIADATNPTSITMKTEGKRMLSDVNVSGQSELPGGGRLVMY